MKGWNPFGKIDMEIGEFLKASPFNKQYEWKEKGEETNKADNENKQKK